GGAPSFSRRLRGGAGAAPPRRRRLNEGAGLLFLPLHRRQVPRRVVRLPPQLLHLLEETRTVIALGVAQPPRPALPVPAFRIEALRLFIVRNGVGAAAGAVQVLRQCELGRRLGVRGARRSQPFLQFLLAEHEGTLFAALHPVAQAAQIRRRLQAVQ